jgi:23S rRNA pseudouridine1911/1915/1917 synthase
VVPDASGDASLLDQARAWVERTFEKPGRAYLGVVHRLDRPVSGVVVFARTSKAAARLTAAFRERRVAKTYRGVAARPPRPERGELEQWLRKDRGRNTVEAFDHEVEGARLARTRWRVLATAGGGAERRCLVELVPETGRPHQLRVAMRSLGAPLLGDLRYGAREPLEDKSVALHAHTLELPHPVRDEVLAFSVPPPDLAVWRFGE